jgi:type IV pilus assembly protein PilN
MARINLLPWRAELRRQLRLQFMYMLGAAFAVAVGVVIAVHLYYEQRIRFQEQRNTFLDGEIAKLDKKIEEIKELKDEKERLVRRIEAIQTLETSRPLEVKLFDEFVTTLPEGVFLKEIDQKGTAITVKGTAQSQSRVSTFMRNVELSKVVTNPRLDVVQTATKEGERVSDFTLKVDQVVPKPPSEDAAKTGKTAKDEKAAKKGGAAKPAKKEGA